MADKPKKKKRNLKEAEAVEVHPDAWERFTKTVKNIVPGRSSDISPEKAAISYVVTKEGGSLIRFTAHSPLPC